MPYVMVPVPEEHALEVMGFVLRLASQPAVEWPPKKWDQATMDRFYGGSNERTRALLSFLAHRARAGKEVAPREIATGLGLERSEVPGILGPLNRQFRKENRIALFESNVRTTTDAQGNAVKRRALVMSKETARMVRAAEQAAGAS